MSATDEPEKTVACIAELIARVRLEGFGYIAPTYKQAKSVAWEHPFLENKPKTQLGFQEEPRDDFPANPALSRADIRQRIEHVCFVPITDIQPLA